MADTASPKVIEIGLLKNSKPVSSSKVSAPYSLFVHATDLVMSTKFIVPPHDISYSVDQGPITQFWRFDTLPGGDSDTRFVNNFYVSDMVCGDYTCKKPVMDLGFSLDNKRSFPATAGSHHITVYVKDAVGNASSKDYDWTVAE